MEPVRQAGHGKASPAIKFGKKIRELEKNVSGMADATARNGPPPGRAQPMNPPPASPVAAAFPPRPAWVMPPPRKALVVGVADMLASNDSSAELVTYSLGSCLGITIYDPVTKIGGLLHIMLPDSNIDTAKAGAMPYMFVDSGVPRLFHAVYNLGADRSRLIVKVAGGAQLLDARGIFNIGARNLEAFRKLLAQQGLNIHASDTGGLNSRTVRLDLANGHTTIKSPGTEPHPL